jgi:predicted transposase/invertase (TIGR01784 family)
MTIIKKSKPAVKTPEKKASTARKKETNAGDLGKYINLLTDYGFKQIFGEKEFLIDFLNSVLNIKGGIADLTYGNTEWKDEQEDGRTTYFDLYCTTGNGEHIIIEMQHYPEKNFRNRVLHYATRLIQKQGEPGKNWKYRLCPVYSVNIVNFFLEKGKKFPAGKYASYFQLIDIDTKHVFNDNLTFVFFELPRFTKKEHETMNIVEKWMFVIKNLYKLNNLPDALRTRIFERLFRKAEIAKMTREQREEYENSLKRYRIMTSVLDELAELKNEKAVIWTITAFFV